MSTPGSTHMRTRRGIGSASLASALFQVVSPLPGILSAWCKGLRLWDGSMMKRPFSNGPVASVARCRLQVVESPPVGRSPSWRSTATMGNNSGDSWDFQWLLSRHRGLLLLGQSGQQIAQLQVEAKQLVLVPDQTTPHHMGTVQCSS